MDSIREATNVKLKSTKQLKLVNKFEDIAVAHKKIILNSLINDIEKNEYEEILKNLKKIIINDNNSSISASNIILYDFLCCFIHLKNKNVDKFLIFHLELMELMNDKPGISIHLDEWTKQIMKKIIINNLEHLHKKANIRFLEPLLEIENYTNLFLQNSHNIIMTSLVINGVISLRDSLFMSKSHLQKISDYLTNLLRSNLCTKSEHDECVICKFTYKIMNKVISNVASPTSNNCRVKNNFITSLIKESLITVNDNKNNAIKNEEGGKTTPTYKGLLFNQTINNKINSRNTDAKITNQENNKDLINTANMNSFPVKLPNSSGKSEVSNYQKYMKNTKYMKISPLKKGKTFSNETKKISFTILSSYQNIISKLNNSRDIFISSAGNKNLKKEKISHKLLRSKVFDGVFNDETNANTGKNEQSSQMTMDMSGNSNNKSFFYRSSFRELSIKKEAIAVASNEKHSLKQDEILIDNKVRRKLNVTLQNVKLNNIGKSKFIKNVNKFTKNPTMIKLDSNCESLEDQNRKCFNSTKNKDSKKYFLNTDNYEKEGSAPSEESNTPVINISIQEKVKSIASEIDKMEKELKDFEENNRKLKSFLKM